MAQYTLYTYSYTEADYIFGGIEPKRLGKTWKCEP